MHRFHRYESGIDLSELEIASVADLDGLVIQVDEPPGPSGRKVSMARM